MRIAIIEVDMAAKNTALVDTLTYLSAHPLTTEAFYAHFGTLADVLYREIVLEGYVTVDAEAQLILTPAGQRLVPAAPPAPPSVPPPP